MINGPNVETVVFGMVRPYIQQLVTGFPIRVNLSESLVWFKSGYHFSCKA